MRAERLVAMLVLLQARGGASAAALAREFGVSVRTAVNTCQKNAHSQIKKRFSFTRTLNLASLKSGRQSPWRRSAI